MTDLPNTPVFRGSSCTALVRMPRRSKMAYRAPTEIEKIAAASAYDAVMQLFAVACSRHKFTWSDILLMAMKELS